MVTEHSPPIICRTLVIFGKTTPVVQVRNEKIAVATIFSVLLNSYFLFKQIVKIAPLKGWWLTGTDITIIRAIPRAATSMK